jgi:tetratricopeptide (TPR) repeat protein
MQVEPSARAGKTLTFRLACWVILLMAFAQLLVLGMGMVARLERLGSERVVERVVVVNQQAPAAEDQAAKEVVEPLAEAGGEAMVGEALAQQPSAQTASPRTSLPAPIPVAAPAALGPPPIADPLVAKLVADGRQARVAEDMRNAIIKLQKAESMAADDPSVLYELGMAYELMGIFDRATSYYQRVYELGTTGAGSLYEAAAKKISLGFAQPEDQRGRLSLGRVQVFKAPQDNGSERVVLRIPIFAVPGEDFDPDEIEVQVNFFDQNQNHEILPKGPDAHSETAWLSAPLDWQGQGEELLQVSYTIPPANLQQAHLFGTRSYYGQVVELSYKGALIDSQAWPRHLARKVATTPEAPPLFLDDELPSDYNNLNPLLPLPVR